MDVDSSDGQTCIAKWSLALGSCIGLAGYLLGYQWLTLGLFFGLSLMLVNWRILSKIIAIAFRFSSPLVQKFMAFLCYHLRFWIIVLIMFLVIPKTNMYFGLGTFLGFLIPKIIMGILIIKYRSEEWWLNRFPAPKPEPHKKLTYIEKELINRNPFEVELIDIEVDRYYKKIKGEL